MKEKDTMKTSQNETPWTLVFILFGAGILSACQVGKVPPVLSDIRFELGVSLFHSGWILSIFNFTGLLLGTCTGIIADTIGHRRLLLTGFVLQIAGCLLGSYTQSFFGLLGTRFLEGAGFLSVIISTPTLIFQLVQSKDIKVALSVWSCYLPAGAALMMVFVPMILTFSSWRGLWQLNAFILAFYAMILFKKTETIPSTHNPSMDGPHKDNQITKIQPRKMLKDIFLTTTSVGPFLLAFIYGVYINNIPTRF